MLKALSKLTKSKSLPPSDDQIRKHRDQKQLRDQWQADVTRLRDIIAGMRREYSQHKDDFALARYEELKHMIKMAIDRMETVVKENKEHRWTSTAGGRASKYSSIKKLKDDASEFAQRQQTMCKEERSYSEMTGKAIEDELEQFRKEIIRLKDEFRQEKDKLEYLRQEYNDSKKFNPTQRYSVLKEMIKQVIR